VDRSDGPHRGRIYVVWIGYIRGVVDVYLAHSDDRGEHWSDPVRVNDIQQIGDLHQLAWVVVDSLGRVYVTYRLLTPDPAGTLRSERLAVSIDGGASFEPSIQISDGMYQQAIFNGDYDQPAIAGTTLHAIWSDARLGDNDIFTKSLALDTQ